MTQKSELTPKNESYPVEYADIPSPSREANTDRGVSLIQKLVFEKLQNEALARGLGWEMLCDIGECSGNGTNIYDQNVKNRRIIFTEDSLRIKHAKRVSFCIELDRWFKERWKKEDPSKDRPSEEDVASDLVRHIVTELDALRAERAKSNIDSNIISWTTFVDACKSMAEKNGLEFEYWTTLCPDHIDDEVPNNMVKFSKTYDPPIKVNGENMRNKSVTIDIYSDSQFQDCFANHTFDSGKAISRIATILYDQLLSYRFAPSKEQRVIPAFFVEMFHDRGVAAIRREAPVIPKEWIEEYAKTDDFRYLCEAAAQCCRSFCDFLHKKLDPKEEK